MSPFAINRRLLWVAVGAAAAGAYLYVRHRVDGLREQQRSNERERETGPSGPSGPSGSSSSGPAPSAKAATTPKAADESGSVSPEGAAPSAGDASEAPAGPAGEKELAEFLAGDSWYDENGWRGIWDREGIADASAWLRAEGKEVLRRARKTLSDHPALLAGCRRRWIVVCRYAGIDVSDAAALWNETDA